MSEAVTTALPDVAGLEALWARLTRRAPTSARRSWMQEKVLLDLLGLGLE